MDTSSLFYAVPSLIAAGAAGIFVSHKVHDKAKSWRQAEYADLFGIACYVGILMGTGVCGIATLNAAANLEPKITRPNNATPITSKLDY